MGRKKNEAEEEYTDEDIAELMELDANIEKEAADEPEEVDAAAILTRESRDNPKTATSSKVNIAKNTNRKTQQTDGAPNRYNIDNTVYTRPRPIGKPIVIVRKPRPASMGLSTDIENTAKIKSGYNLNAANFGKNMASHGVSSQQRAYINQRPAPANNGGLNGVSMNTNMSTRRPQRQSIPTGHMINDARHSRVYTAQAQGAPVTYAGNTYTEPGNSANTRGSVNVTVTHRPSKAASKVNVVEIPARKTSYEDEYNAYGQTEQNELTDGLTELAEQDNKAFEDVESAAETTGPDITSQKVSAEKKRFGRKNLVFALIGIGIICAELYAAPGKIMANQAGNVAQIADVNQNLRNSTDEQAENAVNATTNTRTEINTIAVPVVPAGNDAEPTTSPATNPASDTTSESTASGDENAASTRPAELAPAEMIELN